MRDKIKVPCSIRHSCNSTLYRAGIPRYMFRELKDSRQYRNESVSSSVVQNPIDHAMTHSAGRDLWCMWNM